MVKKIWRFRAIDTWFFKEARQMESFGGSELNSVFPPPPRTVMGAIRTAMGEALGVDWKEYKKENQRKDYKINGFPFGEYIGYGDHTGKLEFNGPWLSIKKNGNWERLYPVPRNLFESDKKIVRLIVDKPVHCDLGKNVYLPKLPDTPDTKPKPKPIEGWITQSGLESALNGKEIQYDEIYFDKPDESEGEDKTLYARESRLGIARDNAFRVAKESMLYQTSHIRPKQDIAIEVDLEVPDEKLNKPIKLIRFGGESRFARIEVADQEKIDINPPPNVDKDTKDIHGIIIILLTPALFDQSGWLPAGFTKSEENKQTVWKGNLHEINLTIHCAVIGKAQREGGWNIAENKPIDVKTIIPAGSIYYCKVDDGNIDNAVKSLHLKKIGADNALGRGQIAVGLWKNNEFTPNK